MLKVIVCHLQKKYYLLIDWDNGKAIILYWGLLLNESNINIIFDYDGDFFIY